MSPPYGEWQATLSGGGDLVVIVGLCLDHAVQAACDSVLQSAGSD
jgi:hypothetical protein